MKFQFSGGTAFDRNRRVGEEVSRHAAASRAGLIERAMRPDQPSEAELRARKRGQASFVYDPFNGAVGDKK